MEGIYYISVALILSILYFIYYGMDGRLYAVSMWSDVDWVLPLCGGLAGCMAEFCTTPLELAKVRIQLGLAGQRYKTNSLLSIIWHIYHNEGLASLWKGCFSAIIRQFWYQCIRMVTYGPIRDLLNGYFSGGNSPPSGWMVVAAGGIAGMIGSWVTNPLDLLKVRSQANTCVSTTAVDRLTLFSDCVELKRSHGFLALWTLGSAASCQRALLVNAAELGTYSVFKRAVIEHTFFTDGVLCHLLSSLMSGLVASLVSAPVDRVKTILMAFTNSAPPASHSGDIISTEKVPSKYEMQNSDRSSFSLLVSIYQAEGLDGLYKGFFATWLRLAPWNTVFFLTFEYLITLCSGEKLVI